MNIRDILDSLNIIETEETEQPVSHEPKRKSLAKDHGEVFSIGDSVLDVDFKAEFAPRPQSVIEFYVPKELRGQGIGTKLLQMAVAKYPMLGGQVSSMASLKIFYNAGFRNPRIPTGSVQDHVDIMNEYSSVYMAHTDEKGVPYSKQKVEGKVNIRDILDKLDLIESEQLLAPNGKPSNLNLVQYQQVRTPEFKSWFGDWETNPNAASKVVDENGEPLVVYHGSPLSFDMFANNSWFTTDPQDAATYSDMAIPGNEHLPQTYPVFLAIKKPKYVDFYIIKREAEAGLDKLKSDSGYIITQGNRKHFVVKNSTQVKSAIGNTGSFNKKSTKVHENR